MKAFFQEILVRVSNFLTGTRPEGYVRKMQMYLLALTLIGTTAVLVYPSFSTQDLQFNDQEKWSPGSNAPTDVIATENLEFPRMREYELAVEEARTQAPLHFSRDYSVIAPVDSEDQVTGEDESDSPIEDPSSGKETAPEKEEQFQFHHMLSKDFDRFAECKIENIGFAAVRSCVRQNIPRWRRLNNNELNSLLVLSDEKIREQIQRAVNIIYQRYVILSDDLNPGVEFNGSTIKVHEMNPGAAASVKTLPRENLIYNTELFSDQVQDRLGTLLSERMPGVNASARSALVDLAGKYLFPLHGSRFNSEATEQERKEAIQAVEIPVKRINRGETIVTRGDVITDEKREALNYFREARFMGKIRRLASISIQQILLIGVVLYFSFQFGFKRLSDVSSNLIVFITIWMFAFTLFLLQSIWGESLEHNEVTYFFGSWVPIGLFVVLLSIVFGELLTIPVGIYLSFLVFVASKYDPHSFVISISMALMGSILGSRIKKRLHFITTSFLITGVGFVTLAASYLYTGRPILGTLAESTLFSSDFVDSMVAVLFSGVSTVFVIAILPMFETLFNVPTRFKLQELSDPANPLLQELFRQAPSTWTHTLMVAAMSEKAGEKLGLNTILIRTGVYYHDIGKMANPGFFIENKHLVSTTHNAENSAPHNAARIIINHVVEGMAMARAARLPREVIAFIPEHHGDSTMSFFYHRALEKGRRKVNREQFRYPGPRPRSKETAIVMLADSVEAASRSLDYVSEENVNVMIRKIMNTKIAENQLDESGLTLGDLDTIRESFREIILSSYHNRPRYPDQDDTTRLESERTASGSGAGKKKTGKKKTSDQKKTAKKQTEKKKSPRGSDTKQ